MPGQPDSLGLSSQHHYSDIPIRDGSHLIHDSNLINIVDSDRAPGTGAKTANIVAQAIKQLVTIHITSEVHQFQVADKPGKAQNNNQVMLRMQTNHTEGIAIEHLYPN